MEPRGKNRIVFTPLCSLKQRNDKLFTPLTDLIIPFAGMLGGQCFFPWPVNVISHILLSLVNALKIKNKQKKNICDRDF